MNLGEAAVWELLRETLLENGPRYFELQGDSEWESDPGLLYSVWFDPERKMLTFAVSREEDFFAHRPDLSELGITTGSLWRPGVRPYRSMTIKTKK